MMKLSIGYPDFSDERSMVENFLSHKLTSKLNPVIDGEIIIQMQKEVEEVRLIGSYSICS